MSFLLFFVYLTISIVIYGVIGVLVYKFFYKKKCLDISTLAEKQIDDYFKAFDVVNDDRKEDKDNEKIYTSF